MTVATLSIWERVLEFWTLQDANVRSVLLGCSILGFVSGALGCFALLRRQSLLGDALAHAALPGICLVYLITGIRTPGLLLTGALGTGLLGTLAIIAIIRYSRIKEDAALGIVLSVFFGVGILLLTHIQHSTTLERKAGLDKYLFGQAASLVSGDVWVMTILSLAIGVCLLLFWKQFKLISFDPGFAAANGIPVRGFEIFLTALIVVAVVIGLEAVGVVLMAAMLIAPAAGARQWTDRLGVMVLLAGTFGAISGMTGAFVSAMIRVPTGPAAVLTATFLLLISLFFAPRRGLIAAALRLWRHRRKVARENLLKDLYRLGERGEGTWKDDQPVGEIARIRWANIPAVERKLGRLEREGLVEATGDGWRLTEEGLAEARRVVRYHRLWEVYLSRRMQLASDHLHRDAEEMEHALPDEVVAELEAILDSPETDPHGMPIPRNSGEGAT